MLPPEIQPIPNTPEVVGPIASALGFDPETASLFMSQPDTRAYAIPGAVVLLTDILEGHRAELRLFPTGSEPDLDIARYFLTHIFNLFQFRVIYAMVPTEQADTVTPLLETLGFHQTGVRHNHRLSRTDIDHWTGREQTGDDLQFTITDREYETGPKVVHCQA